MDLEQRRKKSLFLFEARGLSLAAKEALVEWYALAERLGAYEDRIQALLVSGLNWLDMKQADKALELFERALVLIEQTGEEQSASKAHVLFDLALAYDQKGNVDKALHYATQVWERAERGKDVAKDSQAALLLGKLYIDREEWSVAYDYNQAALDGFERIGDADGCSRALNNMGLICVETGDYARGEALLQQALGYKKELNDTSGLVYTLTELGRLNFMKDDLATAVHYSRIALQTLWESVAFMDKAEVARLCSLFGSVASKTGDRQGAIAYLQRAITYYGQLGYWREWSAATKAFNELIRSESQTVMTRTSIALRDKESLRALTALLGLMDTLEGLYPELIGKSELVTKYALLLGDASGITGSVRESLSHAARLANIGATFPAAEEKTDRIHHDEPDKLPVLGERVLEMVPVGEECRVAVRHQHERFDGTGFPDGLRGADIPIISRILAIVKAYVTRAGSGKADSQLHNQAMNYLRKHAGTRFDPKLVEFFFGMHEFP